MAGLTSSATESDDVSAIENPMYCVNHPKTETLIRCNKCLDPICTKCAIRTPVGLRCPRCVRGARSPLYVLEPQHYVVASVVALAASLVTGALIARAGLLFTFFLAIPAGGLIGEAVMRSIHGKRGRTVQAITGVCIVLGAIAGPWLWSAIAAGTFASLPRNPLAYLVSMLNVNTIFYAVLAIGAAVARLR